MKARNQAGGEPAEFGPTAFLWTGINAWNTMQQVPVQAIMEDTIKGERCCWQSGATAVQACVSFDSVEPWPPPAAVLTVLGGRGLWGGSSDGTDHLRAARHKRWW